MFNSARTGCRDYDAVSYFLMKTRRAFLSTGWNRSRPRSTRCAPQLIPISSFLTSSFVPGFLLTLGSLYIHRERSAGVIVQSIAQDVWSIHAFWVVPESNQRHPNLCQSTVAQVSSVTWSKRKCDLAQMEIKVASICHGNQNFVWNSLLFGRKRFF